MKSKPVLMAGIFTIAYLLILSCLYCFHQGKKSHLNAREAETITYQLLENNSDSSGNLLISERTAVKIANRLFSEKYGNLRTILCKPFDVFLINGYWLVYGPVSKKKPENGPMVIINCHTGMTRIKA
jgi:hypothetical protein